MSRRTTRMVVLMLLPLAAIAISAARAGSTELWQSKVDPDLISAYTASPEHDFIVLLDEQADLGPAQQLSSKLAKGTFVYGALRAAAESTQPSLLAELSARGIQHQSFWIINGIWVRSDLDSLRWLALRHDVKRVAANPRVALQEPEPAEPTTRADASDGIEWNVERIGAPALWAKSIDGSGVVIGGQDTGYDWQHSALKNQYRGWNGHDADHDYNWHDAVHSFGGVCGANSQAPCDDYGHGTHTMGTIVGDDGGSNQIGVAPGARWIGCRNMDRGIGTPATYIECFQWFIAPTRIDGSDPDPALAPDIVNNSWSCPDWEGCGDPDILRPAVEAIRAAGILTVQSAGNSGDACGTINTPAAIYDATFTVGATGMDGLIASFSSRGPVLSDGSYRLKPDVTAPGVSIRSSWPGDNYASLNGTSMAAPHVAGLAALLISSAPDLAGQVDRLEVLIQESAVAKQSAQNCPGFPGDHIPNAVYGYGRIDSVAARLALGQRTWLPLVRSRELPDPFYSVDGS